MAIYSYAPLITYDSGGANNTPATTRFGSSELGSRREAVINLIAYVNAVETPLLDMIAKQNLDNVNWEWVVDDIPDARARSGTTAANILGYIEGADLDPDMISATPTDDRNTRSVLGNYAHTWAESFRVTDLQRGMAEIAVGDEFTLQGWRAYLKLATIFEYNMLWSTAAVGSGFGGTARKMHGLFPWAYDCGTMTADANTRTIASHVVPGKYRGIHYTGTGNDLTADEMYDEILIPWVDRGGNLDQAIMLCGWGVKRILSSFAMSYQGSGATLSAAPRNERSIPAAARTIVDSIDVFETDVGPVYVAKHRYMSGTELRTGIGVQNGTIRPSTSLLICEPDYLRIGVVQGFYTKRLAEAGLSSSAAVAGTLSLACLSPKSLASAHNIAA